MEAHFKVIGDEQAHVFRADIYRVGESHDSLTLRVAYDLVFEIGGRVIRQRAQINDVSMVLPLGTAKEFVVANFPDARVFELVEGQSTRCN